MLDAKNRKIVRQQLLMLNRRKKVSKAPQPPRNNFQASRRKEVIGTEGNLGCDNETITARPWAIDYRTSELVHAAVIKYQARQPLLDRLGNIITDPFGILEEVACPDIPSFDALCHWYSLTDVTVAQRSMHFENAAHLWGDALWDISCKDEALLAALLSLVVRKRAEFSGAQAARRHVQASELTCLSRLRRHISTSPINGSTLVSIAGLAHAGALNSDDGSIDLHMKAVQRLWSAVYSNENEWLFTVFIDLGIVSCTGQCPYLPHDVHVYWAERAMSPSPNQAITASEFALKNTLSFGVLFGQQCAELFPMFRTLHELKILWTSEKLDQTPPFATLYTLVYQTCAHHAFVLDSTNCISPLGDLGAIGIKLCAWSWAAPFVSSNRGIHQFLLKRALAVLPHPRQRLISLWKRQASLQSLLWVLFAITSECYRNCPDDLHHWVEAVRMVCDETELDTIGDLSQCLHDFPAANWWRVDALPRVWKLVRPSEAHQTLWVSAEPSECPRAVVSRTCRFPSTSPFLNFQDGY